MKKLIFIFLVWFSPLFSFGAINECLTDIYFANGILTNEGNATANTDLLRLAIFTETYAGDIDRFENDIGKVKEAYNSTHGSYWDFIESAAEKWGMQWLKDKLWDTVHKADLDLQVKHYKESIRLGHKVLTVAHSQGNLFTNDAYKAILGDSHDWWMTPYFKIVSIASPMHFMITLDTPEISWDNDLVADLGLDLMSGRTYSPVRKIKWEFYDGVPIDSLVARPRHNYVYSDKVNEIYKDSWKPVEGLLQKFDSNVHAFTFYMGKPIKDGNTGEIFYNPFDENKTLQTDIAKTKIMTVIKTQLDNLKKVTSQWITDQEYEKNTCNHKITLKHQFDPSIEMPYNVYPFNASKKLYQAKNEQGVYEYVKASCGGKNILTAWDGKKDNECLMIDNVKKEKIGGKLPRHSFSLYSGVGAGGSCNSSSPYSVGIWGYNTNVPYVHGTIEGITFYKDATAGGKVEFNANNTTLCVVSLKKITSEQMKGYIQLIYADEQKAIGILEDKYGANNVEIINESIGVNKCFSYDYSNRGYACNFTHSIGGYVYY